MQLTTLLTASLPPSPGRVLQKDTKTHTLVMDSIMRLRYYGVPSDYIPVSPGCC